jgi:DNA-binding CsgD family transcriptional regulator
MARAAVAEWQRYARQWPVPVQVPEEELAPLAALETPSPRSRVPPTTVGDAPRATGGPPRHQPPLRLLSGAEQTVAALRAEGKSYTEIGERLGVSRQRAWQLGQHIEAAAR